MALVGNDSTGGSSIIGHWLEKPENNITYEDFSSLILMKINFCAESAANIIICPYLNKKPDGTTKLAELTKISRQFFYSWGTGQKITASIYKEVGLPAELTPQLCKDLYKKDEYKQVMLFKEFISQGVIKESDINVTKEFLGTLKQEKHITEVLEIINRTLNLDLEKDNDVLGLIDKVNKTENIYSNPDDNRSIYHHSGEWSDFIAGVTASVNNMDQNHYPLAKLNKDGSITFLVERGGNGEISEFDQKLNKSYIVDQLDFHRQKSGLPLVGGKSQFFEKDEYNSTTNLTTYTLNITQII